MPSEKLTELGIKKSKSGHILESTEVTMLTN